MDEIDRLRSERDEAIRHLDHAVFYWTLYSSPINPMRVKEQLAEAREFLKGKI